MQTMNEEQINIENGPDIDDVFQQIADDMEINDVGDLGDTKADIEEWFEANENSPKNFRNNIITGATGDNYKGQMTYSKGIVHNDYDTLSISSASLKSCPYVFDEFIPVDVSGDPEFTAGDAVKDGTAAKNICIFGHGDDVDDEFGSRLDMKLVKRFAEDIKSKFTNIELYGAFSSVESMQKTILGLYERLSDDSPLGRVLLHLDSKLRDDNKRIRTIADLISSGYIHADVVGKPNVVEYVFKKFDKKRTARLFTKTIAVQNTLFSSSESENNESEQMSDDTSVPPFPMLDDEDIPF